MFAGCIIRIVGMDPSELRSHVSASTAADCGNKSVVVKVGRMSKHHFNMVNLC